MRKRTTNKIKRRDIALLVLAFLNIVVVYTIRQDTSSSFWFSSWSSPVVLAVQHRKKAALCAIVKSEELYLDEWVDYHKGLGFDTIYIYDNSDGFEMKQWGKLKGNHVHLLHLPGSRLQLMSYLDCHSRVKRAGIFEWIAFFDVDEFLVLRKHEHVSDMLEEHCSVGRLGVNWLWFDYNNWMVGAPEPITRRFLYREKKPRREIKTIARMEDISRINIFGDPHSFVVPYLIHDTNNKAWMGPRHPRGPIDVVALHHYHSKSYKEQVQKRSRGRASSPTESNWKSDAEKLFTDALANANDTLPLDDTVSGNPKYVFDDSAWQLLKKNVPAYRLYDEIGLLPSTKMTGVKIGP